MNDPAGINSIPNARRRPTSRRMLVDTLFVIVCVFAAFVSVLVLATLLTSIIVEGTDYLSGNLLSNYSSSDADKAGIKPAMWGTIWVCLVCAFVAVPIGVGTAVLLEEYKPTHPRLRKLHAFVQLNITNLAGVPSIVYGILGLTVFVGAFNLFGNPNRPHLAWGFNAFDQFKDSTGQYLYQPVQDLGAETATLRDGMVAYNSNSEAVTIEVVPPAEAARRDEPGVVSNEAYVSRLVQKKWWYFQLPFGRSVLAGGLTLMLVILPIVIISSQEAIRAVPSSLRQGALALGATRWQMIWNMTLPASVPGIMTGTILAMSRAIGEAAPILIVAGGIVFITYTPEHLMDKYTVMPLQIFDWAKLPQKEFHKVAAAGIIVLLAVLLSFNALAVFIRYKFQKPLS